MRASLALFFTALIAPWALAKPLEFNKRWTCQGDPSNNSIFYCEPKAGCKNEGAWGDCATDGLLKCGDPTPSQTVPVSECQSAAFANCGSNGDKTTEGNGEKADAPPSNEQSKSGGDSENGSYRIQVGGWGLMILYMIIWFELI